MDIPLPWERLLWRGHPAFQIPGRERYVLTDVRLVRLTRTEADEILVRDIGDILCDESRLDPFIGSTVIVRSRDRRRAAIVLRRVRRGPQLAALIEWLSGEPDERRSKLDADALDAAMAWDPRRISRGLTKALAGLAAALALVFGVAIGLHGTAPSPASYAPDDPIYPAGQKRPTDDIVQYMERDVMPWARATLGPIKGGSDRVTCETCHGQHADLRGWSMPAVAALPQPDVKEQGWEHYGGPMDAQMRNAIYGYLAESDKQVKAGYMREVVMPGMARLLHRPAYDFTRPYEYNRSRLAFGCYHCHRVS